MKIYYKKSNGQIVGTIEGFGDHSGVELFKDDDTVVSEDITLGHKLEKFARELEDPQNKKVTIRSYRFKSGKPVKIPKEELEAEESERSKQKHKKTLELTMIKETIRDTEEPIEKRFEALLKLLRL